MSDYKPFEQLALEALAYYDIPVSSIEFFVEETNVFFLVYSEDKRYVLKVFQEESSKIEDNLIEAILLQEVAKKTNIVVPKVIPTIDGDAILIINSNTFNIEKRVMVFDYMDGIDFNEHETDELFIQVGSVMATMHQAMKDITLPEGLSPKRWDTVFYYREEPIYYHDQPYRSFFTDDDVEFLDRFIAYLNTKLPQYYDADTHVIHADMNPWNIKLHEGEIRLLDFEEGLEGSVLHELAIFMFYYRYDRNYDYKHIYQLVCEGYQEITALPEISWFDVELLIMARTTNFINYVLILYDDPRDYITERIRRLREFVNVYNLVI